MVKAVLIQSTHAPYRDAPGRHYHFPKRPYLGVLARAVGDWVVFYEGRRGDNRGYHAVARIERIVDDPTDPTHGFALLEPGTYLTFPNEVPRLRPDGRPWETGLPPMGGFNTSAVRLLSEADFAAILEAGLADIPAAARAAPAAGPPGFAEAPAGFAAAPPDPAERLRRLTERAVRDAAFARAVKRAYGARCAVSGLELRNGGGRPEVQAAHILPVEARGPDAVANGLALSGTVHWMFDRGLISAEDDGKILVAPRAVPEDVQRRLIRPEGRLLLPERASDRPHPEFLRWHRENRFKG